jgi:hypothetical protein
MCQRGEPIRTGDLLKRDSARERQTEAMIVGAKICRCSYLLIEPEVGSQGADCILSQTWDQGLGC